jgi:hypothetical protein
MDVRDVERGHAAVTASVASGWPSGAAATERHAAAVLGAAADAACALVTATAHAATVIAEG